MVNPSPDDDDPLMVLFGEAYSIMGGTAPSPDLVFVDGGMARVPAPAPVVVDASHTAWRMARLARFMRLATMFPVLVTGNKMDALLDNLSDICLGRSLLFSPEMGEHLAQVLDLLAAQIAQQDALKGGRS
jgi:hypothetical protein